MFEVYLIAFLVLLLIYFHYDRRKRYEKFWKHIYAIPGPKHYPIIGSTEAYSTNPVTLFELMCERNEKFRPICAIWSFNVAIVIISTPEDIELVLSGMKHISKGLTYHALRDWLGTGLLTSTGSKWQKRRKIVTPAFHFSILQDFVNVFNKETDNLLKVLKSYCNEPYVNVLDPLTDYALNAIGETSFGVDMNLQPQRNEYKKAIYQYGDAFVYRFMRPWLRIPFIYKMSSVSKKVDESVGILHGFSASIFKEKKKSFRELKEFTKDTKKRMALIDILLASASEGSGIDDEGIKEEIDTFMFEGHDTTTMGISLLLLTLANQPKWQDLVREEIYEVLGDSEVHPEYKQLQELKLMERCIKETLRIFPIVPVISRVADEDIKTTTGYTIPKGTNVHIPIITLHRSKEIWENPYKFDPDRFLPENKTGRHPFAYLPFSAGPRNCIGQRYAILEIKAALCGILRKFTLLSVDKPYDVVFKSDIVLRPHTEIRVKFVPRE